MEPDLSEHGRPVEGADFEMRLSVYVKPFSKETCLLAEPDGTLIMKVNASPTKGKANREIVKWLSKQLQIPSSHVQIISGVRSKKKIVQIFGPEEKEILRRLGISI
jgi:hypothetical protein